MTVKPTIGIFVGSNRAKSNTFALVSWIKSLIASDNFTYKVFTPTQPYDLLNTPINSVAPMALKSSSAYEDPVIQKFSEDVSKCNGFIFITPVYNHSYSGQLKIMIDHLFHEFAGKPGVIISQGPGSPASAVEALSKLAGKVGVKVVDEIAWNIPRDYVATPKRITTPYEATTDTFLKAFEPQLEQALGKLESELSK